LTDQVTELPEFMNRSFGYLKVLDSTQLYPMIESDLLQNFAASLSY